MTAQNSNLKAQNHSSKPKTELKALSLQVVVLSFALCALSFVVSKEAEASTISRAPNNLGLVGYWSFNDATSTTRSTIVTDSSGQGNHGIMTNMANPATASSGVADGKLGKALNFDGTNDVVSLPQSAASFLDPLVNHSISAWFKTSKITQEAVYARRKDTGARTFRITVSDSFCAVGKVSYVLTDTNASGTIICSTKTIYTDNQWHFLTVTLSGTTMSLYLDGVLDGTGTYSQGTNLGTYSANFIGAESTAGTAPFDGLIDEVRIYNRALSASEVQALYKSGAAKFTPPSNLGLVGYWPL